jgi:hypothetical protein
MIARLLGLRISLRRNSAQSDAEVLAILRGVTPRRLKRAYDKYTTDLPLPDESEPTMFTSRTEMGFNWFFYWGSMSAALLAGHKDYGKTFSVAEILALEKDLQIDTSKGLGVRPWVRNNDEGLISHLLANARRNKHWSEGLE